MDMYKLGFMLSMFLLAGLCFYLAHNKTIPMLLRLNRLYQCKCQHYVRNYQLVGKHHDECPHCTRTIPIFTKINTYKWMDYVEEFPKLSLRELWICLRVQKKLTARQEEVNSYETWFRLWTATYQTRPRTQVEWNDPPPPAVKTDFDSVRKMLDYPKLKP